jgi:hypothetical protein
VCVCVCVCVCALCCVCVCVCSRVFACVRVCSKTKQRTVAFANTCWFVLVVERSSGLVAGHSTPAPRCPSVVMTSTKTLTKFSSPEGQQRSPHYHPQHVTRVDGKGSRFGTVALPQNTRKENAYTQSLSKQSFAFDNVYCI